VVDTWRGKTLGRTIPAVVQTTAGIFVGVTVESPFIFAPYLCMFVP
jgi:hypothetical protein